MSLGHPAATISIDVLLRSIEVIVSHTLPRHTANGKRTIEVALVIGGDDGWSLSRDVLHTFNCKAVVGTEVSIEELSVQRVHEGMDALRRGDVCRCACDSIAGSLTGT